MRKIFLLSLLFLMMLLDVSCSKVPSGYVGVKVYLLGSSKGVESEELKVGRYWIGINEELYLFPIYKQNYVWTKDPTEGSENDESITFQTKEGLSVGADIGITYQINPEKVSGIFEKYRKGVGEITDVFLRNYVRDTFNMVSSTYSVESVYGEGKAKLLDEVNLKMKNSLEEEGIMIERIYLIGELRLPPKVVDALNMKIEATQKAQQIENEVRQAKAEAEKVIVKAEAEAEANRLITQSINDNLLRYESIKKWNGQLPRVTGGSTPLINIK